MRFDAKAQQVIYRGHHIYVINPAGVFLLILGYGNHQLGYVIAGFSGYDVFYLCPFGIGQVCNRKCNIDGIIIYGYDAVSVAFGCQNGFCICFFLDFT